MRQRLAQAAASRGWGCFHPLRAGPGRPRPGAAVRAACGAAHGGRARLHLRQLVSGLGRAPGTARSKSIRPPAEPRFLEPLSGLYWQIRRGAGGRRRRSAVALALGRHPAPAARSAAAGEVHQHTIPGPGGASLLAVERHVALPASLGGGTSAPRWRWTGRRSMPPVAPSPPTWCRPWPCSPPS